MTYLHQPNPEMAAPEYWGGIDIYDDNAFTGDDFTAATLCVKAATAVSARLTDCLQKVSLDDYAETSSLMGATFNASEHQLPNGSVVIIDSEQLRRDMYSSALSLDPRTLRPYGGVPIDEPFAEYWKQSHLLSADHESFGKDEMHFPDQVTYRRYLNWGVCLTGTTGNRVVSTQHFDSPRIGADGVGMDAAPSRASRVMPFEIGGVRAYGDFDRDDRTYRVIERVREVKVVHHAFNSGEFEAAYGPDPGWLQRLGQMLASKLS